LQQIAATPFPIRESTFSPDSVPRFLHRSSPPPLILPPPCLVFPKYYIGRRSSEQAPPPPNFRFHPAPPRSYPTTPDVMQMPIHRIYRAFPLPPVDSVPSNLPALFLATHPSPPCCQHISKPDCQRSFSHPLPRTVQFRSDVGTPGPPCYPPSPSVRGLVSEFLPGSRSI